MTTQVRKEKLDEFLGKVVCDLGAAMSAVLVVLGDKLGLYKAMAASGPITPRELAERTGTHERYVRERGRRGGDAVAGASAPRPTALGSRARPVQGPRG